jgi:hypothetical protein
MSRKVKWLLAAFAVVTPLSIVASIYFYNPDPDKLNEAIRSIGFYPITPPTNLRAPGSICHVTPNGKYYTMLCEAQPGRLSSVMRTSPTNKQVSTELRKVQLGINTDIIQQVNSSADAKLIETIKLDLNDVEVLEVSLEDLATIADELLKRESCLRVVKKYLEDGEYVCQGQQVVKATTTYTVAVDNVGTGHLQKAAELIKLNIASDARVEGDKVVSGKNLYYGMKLAPRCMYLPDRASRRPPVTWWQRALNRFPMLEII